MTTENNKNIPNGNGDESAQVIGCLGQAGLIIAWTFLILGLGLFFAGAIEGDGIMKITGVVLGVIGLLFYLGAAKEKALAKSSIRSEQTYQLLKELQSQRENEKPASDSNSGNVQTVKPASDNVNTVRQDSDIEARLDSMENRLNEQLNDIKDALAVIKASLK